MSIGDELKPILLSRFPSKNFQFDPSGRPLAVIEGTCAEVGKIVIYDDGDEATVIVGNFTHGHFEGKKRPSEPKGSPSVIATEVSTFLTELFADRILMYGSKGGGGGWASVDAYDDEELKDWDLFVWSGPFKAKA
jgi:hypothetical protein